MGECFLLSYLSKGREITELVLKELSATSHLLYNAKIGFEEI
ncbi:351_t:CDS:2 [Entrophospora sp. SA101]|nr:10915_t:CDS:2 [Entrophospora sp. SA101]CAJ0634817.1 9037_t:CDS:2 [Entrophospora sp. SA101]CAJ0642894.1 351_t:CDS:2 [Entrophospora sp. SA101]CAJ0829255.1 17234_t:CDS:2 [Entrophospora sp. SA101]CAJ0847243.1 634_t:CDS:2 [Entrophospora sp. SA101]